MPINLTISAETVGEFDELIARFSRSGSAAPSAIMPEIAHTDPAKEAAAAVEAAPGKPRRAAKAKDDKPEGGAPAAADTGSTSDTKEGNADTTASSGAAADPMSGAATGATTQTPAASSPADQAQSDAGEVTIQNLKDAMAELLKAKSASFAMQTLEAATGCKSLTSGSPNVVEKAKDDPTLMRKTLDALKAGLTA